MRWSPFRRVLHRGRGGGDGAPYSRPDIFNTDQGSRFKRQISGKPADDRLRVRRQASLPRLEAVQTFFEASLTKLQGKSDLAGAMRYALTRWPALVRHAEDGRCEISNNSAERAIGRWRWAASTTSSPAPMPAAGRLPPSTR